MNDEATVAQSEVACEPCVAAAGSAAPVVSVAAPTSGLRTGAATGLLAVIVLFAVLYLARAFCVPLLIGILASYALHPVVYWLKACRVPRAAGAALVIFVLAGSVSWIAVYLSDDAAAVIETLPEAARKLRQNLSDARTGTPTALQNMRDAAKEIEGVAADAGAKQGARVATVAASEPTAWLWGIWGLLLGAPLIAIAKVVCDRVDALNAAGELLGR